MLSYQVKCYISTSDVPFNFMGNPGDGFLVTRVLNRHRLVDARFHGGPKLVLQLDFTLTSTLTFAFYVERDKMLLETIPISFREKGNCVELACITVDVVVKYAWYSRDLDTNVICEEQI